MIMTILRMRREICDSLTKQMDPDEIWSYKLRTRLHVKIDEAMHDHLYTENKITLDMWHTYIHT